MVKNKTGKRVFVICSVRGADDEYKAKLEGWVKVVESYGHKCHLPHRDTNQEAKGIEICTQNMNAIKDADEVAVFYSSKSLGTHFDMGVAFALGKKINVIENEQYDEGKSFARMLVEWAEM